MITLVVTYSFVPANDAAAREHLRALVAASRAEPGCRRYDVFAAKDAPGDYLIFEQYDDEAALAAHRASPHFADHGKNGIQPIAASRNAVLYEALP